MQSTDWDIFRYLIAVADGGSAVAAAERLGVNGSTVLRRISKFEEERGIRLFDRLSTGYAPTAECEVIIKTARSIQEQIFEIDRNITGRDLRLEGRLTVTTTDTFMEVILADIFSEFCAANPAITLDVAVTTSRLNLGAQDADIAIRASRNPPEHLVGQRVSALAFAIYGPASMAQLYNQAATPEQLKAHSWIGMGEAIASAPPKEWMDKNVPKHAVKMTADSFPALRRCIAAGAGISVLPICLGEKDDRLIRLSDTLGELETSVWVLAHPDVRTSAKIRALTQYVSKRMREASPIFEAV